MSVGATIIGSGELTDDESHLLNPNDRLDHFTVLDQLGAGGMGAVYRARDESLQRYVALKVIAGRPGEGGKLRCERLIQEARAQARVSHPNVVHIYYVGIHDDCPFFAMEYVAGQSLARSIRGQRLEFGDIVRIGLQTTEALRHSASLGVIHGDVKPANILVTEQGHIKLSDFGLSNGSDRDNQRSGPAGTLDYMAPEVAAGQTANAQSDMYSLGVMLYQLTFGELPLQSNSDSLEESLRQRQTATIRFPTFWPKDRPEAWRTFLSRLMQRVPSARFASYDDVLAELTLLEPAVLQRAGRVSRMIAWLIDTIVTGILLGISAGVTMWIVGTDSGKQSRIDVVIFVLQLVLGSLLLWYCRRTQSTPGRKLMQLKCVDHFGLPPSRWKVVVSSLSTFILYINVIGEVLIRGTCLLLLNRSVDVDDSRFGTAVKIATGCWIVFNGIWLTFSRRQQSLLDRLLGLFVVLDIQRPAARKQNTG